MAEELSEMGKSLPEQTRQAARLEAEIREYVYVQGQRRRLFPRAMLVGFLAGGAAVMFRWVLEAGEAWRDGLLRWAHQYPAWGWLLPMLVGALGVGVALSLVRAKAPEAAGSGIPHLKAVLARLRSLHWQTVLPVKFVGGALCIGNGLALGREGPTVQMGGAVGAAVAQWLNATPRERQTLIAAGAGAGLAAAFNAPLAGLLFVLEELQRHFAPTVFGAAFVAALIADIMMRFLTNQLPVFHVEIIPAPPLVSLPAFLGLGVLTGLLGVAFNRGLLGSLTWFARLHGRLARRGPWAPSLIGAGVGAIVEGLGWFVPSALGGGQRLVEAVLQGQVALAFIPFWFLLRFGLTLLSYGCGAPGGIFAPLLVLGALIGLAVGDAAHWWLPGTIDHPGAFAGVGMAAYFTAIVRAPLTGIVLIVEMTNNYAQILPLFMACFTAYAVAEFLGDEPIYEALLERDLKQNGSTQEERAPLVVEFIVQEGSHFDGKQVHELGLPAGCVLITVHRDQYELVPTPNTLVEVGNRLTVIIAPEAPEALEVLRKGCETPRAQG
jgi:CIC family chloride channel protein